MYGGITGHGYGMRHRPRHTLGGLLLGGAYKKVSELSEEEHAKRLAAARAYRERRKAEGYVPAFSKLKGRRALPTRGPRKSLNHLRDAEYHAALLEEEEGHPDFAKYLSDDYVYNTELYDSGKIPMWLREKYTQKSGWFDAMKRAKDRLKGAPEYIYTSSSGKQTRVKEGSVAFQKYVNMQRVREHPEFLQRVA